MSVLNLSDPVDECVSFSLHALNRANMSILPPPRLPKGAVDEKKDSFVKCNLMYKNAPFLFEIRGRLVNDPDLFFEKWRVNVDVGETQSYILQTLQLWLKDLFEKENRRLLTENMPENIEAEFSTKDICWGTRVNITLGKDIEQMNVPVVKVKDQWSDTMCVDDLKKDMIGKFFCVPKLWCIYKPNLHEFRYGITFIAKEFVRLSVLKD